jgi:hypothetical protein
MWEKMYAAAGILGGAIWSGIDDTFFLPGGPTVGYGTWGPIDGWRRPKPEYWHLKKIYSPIRLGTERWPARAGKETADFEVENRHDFTNLKEMTILCGPVGGPKRIVSADIAPRQKGIIRLPLFLDTPDAEVSLEFFSPEGRLIDSYLLRTPEAVRTSPPKSGGAGSLSCREADGLIIISGQSFSFLLEKATGRLRGGSLSDRELNLSGPDLMLLPLNSEGDTQMTKGDPSLPFTDACVGWKAGAVTVKSASPNLVEIEVSGSYREAHGSFLYQWSAEGTLTVTYDFVLSDDKLNPRQIGLVWDLPTSFTQLSWARRGLWSVYPSDHIGRNRGTANLEGYPVSPVGPAAPPTWAWKDDSRETGSNDFRSTKENIHWVRLLDPSGRGIIATGTEKQAARAWKEPDRVRLLIADYVNPGSERFFRAHAKLEDKPLKKGDRIMGTGRLRMIFAPGILGAAF